MTTQRSVGHRTTWALVALAMALVAGLGFASARATDHVHQGLITYSPPTESGQGYAVTFEQLVKHPDLIVVATLEGLTEGRVIAPDGAPPLSLPAMHLRAEETLAVAATVRDLAQVAEGDLIVELDTPGALERVRGLEGRRVLVFLWLKRDVESAAKYFRLISPEAMFEVNNGTTLAMVEFGIENEVSFVDRVEGLTLDELRQQIAGERP